MQQIRGMHRPQFFGSETVHFNNHLVEKYEMFVLNYVNNIRTVLDKVPVFLLALPEFVFLGTDLFVILPQFFLTGCEVFVCLFQVRVLSLQLCQLLLELGIVTLPDGRLSKSDDLVSLALPVGDLVRVLLHRSVRYPSGSAVSGWWPCRDRASHSVQVVECPVLLHPDLPVSLLLRACRGMLLCPK